jgi:PAS domain S-box-containing protein
MESRKNSKDNQKSSVSYERYLDSVPAGVMVLDKEFNIIYLNDYLLKIARPDLKPKDCIGKKCYELFKTSLCLTDECPIDKTIKTNQENRAETTIMFNDKTVYASMIAKPIYQEDGAIEGYIEIVTDITDLYKAQKKMKLLLELSPVAIAEWRPGGELIEINDQFAKMVGYTKEEVMKMGWKNLTAPEYQGEPDRLHEERALKGIDKTYRKEYIHKDGHRVPIFLVTEPVFNEAGELDYYLSYVQDLTPIVYTEKYYSDIISASNEGIEIFDIDGKLYDVNAAFCKLVGYKKEELLSEEFTWFKFIAEEDKKKLQDSIKHIFQSNEAQRIEVEFIHKNGRRIPVQISVNKLTKQPQWNKDRLVAIISDLTEIKRTTEQLQHATDKLNALLKELSTPVIKVWDDILVMPLIGSMTSDRMRDAQYRLLNELYESNSRVIIIDITGVPVMDTMVANGLLKTIKAVKIIGAETIITGVSPEVASTLVTLDVELDTRTASKLSEGLNYALNFLKYNIKLKEE